MGSRSGNRMGCWMDWVGDEKGEEDTAGDSRRERSGGKAS